MFIADFQSDYDGDGIGNREDNDVDGDGVGNSVDTCEYSQITTFHLQEQTMILMDAKMIQKMRMMTMTGSWIQ